MKTLRVPTSCGEIQLSKIVLGSSNFGTRIHEDAAFMLLETYAQHGGSTIDTASVYGDWQDEGIHPSEACIGKWLTQSHYGKEMVVISKCCHPLILRPGSRVGAEYIAHDLEHTLRSLGRDWVDVYLLHRDDTSVPVSEIIDTLHKYVLAGNIKAIGASNWSVARFDEANRYATDKGLTPFALSEMEWGLAHAIPHPNDPNALPMLERKDYEYYYSHGIPVLAYSSQGGGVIAKLAAGREDVIAPRFREKYLNGITRRRMENTLRICREYGITPTQAVLAYITCNALPAAAIIGPGSMSQLLDSLTAADVYLPPHVMCELVRL